MTHSTRERIQDIYLDALALPDSERGVFIANACAGNPDCIREVKSLLEAAAHPGILDNPVANLGLTSISLIGATIDDRYEIEKELPHGGMSQVYVALDLRLNRQPVVIKVLSKALVQDTYARQHFDQEVEALLRLKDPGVVDVKDRGDLADGTPYIVMEYVEGNSLRSQILNDGMDLECAASILAQVGTALELVHQSAIFHRDVKPENILLRRGKDSVVLIDFGIARVTDSAVALSTVDGAKAGTPPYMSPEQLRGERVTAASDIYSMAVVAYEIITARRPFSPNSPAQMLDLQREGVRVKPADLRPDLPKKAQRIILRALSFDPKNRPQSAKQFGDELAEALNEPRDVKGPSPPIAKLLGITAGVLILALLSYGIYKILVKPQPPQPRSLISQTTQTKGFNYWLTIQRMHEGQDYQESYKSNGDDVFDNGDKFQLSVQSVYSGYLYIFNDASPEAGTTSFRLIYPKQAVNDASASVGDNHTVQTEWITFRGPAGTDNFWIVWSASPLAELESAKNEALKHPQAGLTDQNLVNVKTYLKTMDAEVNARAARIKASQDVQVRKRSDIVLTLAEFKHR
jgi:serine/threonine protein kinase